MPPSQPTQGLDPQVVALAQAVKQEESGNNPTAAGKSGEFGAYQYEPDTWAAQSSAAGVNVPLKDATMAQQNQVWYTWAKGKKEAGYTPAQIASMQNAGEGEPNAYTGTFSNGTPSDGTNSSGVQYNVPTYVKSVLDNYQKFKAQGLPQAPSAPDAMATVPGYQAPTAPGQQAPPQTATLNGYAPPTPPTPPQQPAQPTAQPGTDPSGGFLSGLMEDLSGTNPDNIGTQIENTVKGAGNFLFPIVGDVANDVTGKSQKTALQQVGDAGLSALPFIPGLGEAGDAARGAEVVGEGAADAAKSGVLPALLKNAGIGYGAGTAANLSQGQSIGQALTPGLANIGGAVAGGGTPLLLKGLGGLTEHIAGVSPGMASDLAQTGSVQDFNDYVNAAKNRAANGVRSPSPLNLAADQLDSASDQIQSKIADAGKAVGDAKRAGGGIGLKSVTDPATGEISSAGQVAKDFSDRVASDYGLNLKVEDGQVVADSIAGRARQIPSAEVSRIQNAYQQLLSLKGAGGNVRQATDIMANLDDLVDYSKTDQIGVNHDPLEGLLKHTRGNLNNVVRNSAPDLANANDRFSQLKGLDKEIGGMAGKNLQKGELLMKRVFSGDKSGEVNDLFGKIKQETGVDLVNHAVLAKYAIDNFGDSSQKSLLQQAIEGGVEAHTGGVIPAILKMGGAAAQKTFANPETIGRNIVRGKSAGILPSLLTKGAIRAGSAL